MKFTSEYLISIKCLILILHTRFVFFFVFVLFYCLFKPLQRILFVISFKTVCLLPHHSNELITFTSRLLYSHCCSRFSMKLFDNRKKQVKKKKKNHKNQPWKIKQSRVILIKNKWKEKPLWLSKILEIVKLKANEMITFPQCFALQTHAL